jgi:ribosomal protein L31
MVLIVAAAATDSSAAYLAGSILGGAGFGVAYLGCVEVCSSCHPTFTGVDRATIGGSRIEQFNRRRAFAVA